MGQSYVYKQPETEDEIAACMEGVQGCPAEAVGDDGDRFDWKTTPIIDWHTISGLYDRDSIEFDISAPTIPFAETLAEEERDRAAYMDRTLLQPNFVPRIVTYGTATRQKSSS